MQKHVTAVGILRIVGGVLGILAAMLILTVMIGVGVFVQCVDDDPMVLPILAAIGIPLALVIGLLSVAGIIVGIGVLKRRSWARYLSMVLAILDLFDFPIGTAMGAYTLWALTQAEVAALFE